ncbi:hypothetical protein [Pseudorhodobacter sp. E13]|uniref:hypothetical protein n=1 Tax=Pseudorhodobacter sp. E13 TaxID=2487931 RepID=UPI000F8C726D|nr:hypothetical protein [Pseudorhodobacter sp. E13]
MRRKAMLAVFVIAAGLTVFFITRAIFFAVFWMDPERGLHPVEPWMTPRYIGRTYDLPRADLQEILHLTPGETPRVPLEKLAQQRGIPVEDLIAEIEALIAARASK